MADAPTTNGGQPIVQPMPYDPPSQPSGGSTNHGNCGTQGKH